MNVFNFSHTCKNNKHGSLTPENLVIIQQSETKTYKLKSSILNMKLVIKKAENAGQATISEKKIDFSILFA